MANAAFPEPASESLAVDSPPAPTPAEVLAAPPADILPAKDPRPPLELVFPATLPCLRSEELTPDHGVVKRTLEEGAGRLVPANAKIWITLEGRKENGEYLQRESALHYTIGVKGEKVLSQGLITAFATMRVGECAWLYLSKPYHLFPPDEGVWLKVRVLHALEEFEDKPPKRASAEERVALAERLIAEANIAAREGLHRDASRFYNRAIDAIRGFKAGNVGQWAEEEWKMLKDTHVRCECNLAQVAINFSEVPGIEERVRAQRLQQALSHCTVVLNLEPKHPKGLYRKAKAHYQLDEIEPAYNAAYECTKVAPGNHQVNSLYQEILKRRRIEDEKCRPRFRKVLEEMGKSS